MSCRILEKSATGRTYVQWPLDDYIVHCVVRRGPVVSRPIGPTLVEVYDLAENEKGAYLIFHMSILDASVLSNQWPEFESVGLLGTFRLQGSTGLLKLVKAYDKTRDDTTVRQFLTDEESHEYVRSRYVYSLGVNKNVRTDSN